MPLPPPPSPPGAASGAKKISAIMKNLKSHDGEVLDVTEYGMDIDDEYGVMDFITEVAELDDPNPEEDDECKFPGFHRPAHTGMRIKDRSENKEGEEGKESEEGEEGEEGKEEDEEDEDSPLYMMDALMSEADVLMSSVFKPSHYSKQSKEDVEEDIEQTPIIKKVKKGKMKEVKGKEERKTKGVLLREMITRASCGHMDGGNAVSGPHDGACDGPHVSNSNLVGTS